MSFSGLPDHLFPDQSQCFSDYLNAIHPDVLPLSVVKLGIRGKHLNCADRFGQILIITRFLRAEQWEELEAVGGLFDLKLESGRVQSFLSMRMKVGRILPDKGWKSVYFRANFSILG